MKDGRVGSFEETVLNAHPSRIYSIDECGEGGDLVRIHVVRASRLLLGAGIAVLLAVVLWLAGRALLGG